MCPVDMDTKQSARTQLIFVSFYRLSICSVHELVAVWADKINVLGSEANKVGMKQTAFSFDLAFDPLLP
jgi:hypothetical protein